jgi:polyhydroxybutyrate depolymerase
MKKILLLMTALSVISCSKNDDVTPLVPTPTPDSPSEQKTINITVDGTARSFVVFLPTGYNNVASKMPMIFAIHGGGGTGDGMIQLADFRTIANKDKVVLVYPTGIQTSWNDGRPTDANIAGINDVNFFSTMCDYMVTNNKVDPTRIYATGISNGGFMSSRLGCELSSKIAAIAVDAATIESTTIASSCNPGRPVPALYIHGTLDTFVPILGGAVTVGAGGTILSHAQAITKWITINNCATTAVVTDLPDLDPNDGTTIKKREYLNGTNGAEVVSYVVTGGGHTWPQGYQYLAESIIGKTSQDMNANEVIWAFFKRFKR